MSSSKFLIDENPLQLLPSLAEKIGLNEAIVLQQVHYWLRISEKANDKRKFIDGCWWTYGSYEQWQKDNFTWWSTNTIGRIFRKLESDGYLVSRKKDASDWNQTKWYTIDYTKLEQSDVPDWHDPAYQDGTILNRNSETSAETSADIEEPPFSEPDWNELELNQVLKLPEIASYRKVTGRIPGRPQYPVIWETIRRYNFTESYLVKFWRAWVTKGYRSENLTWLTEWAVKNEVPSYKKPQTPQGNSNSASTVDYSELRLAAMGDA